MDKRQKVSEGGGAGAGASASASASASAPPPATISTVPQAAAVLQQYFRAQNRPYSIIQLHDNLHGKVNKALLEGALAALVEGGVVCCKEYGKAKVFWPSQAGFSEITAEEVARVNAKRDDLEAQCTAATAARKAVEARVSALTSGPSGAALEAALAEEQRAVAALEARVAGIRAAAGGGGGGGAGSGGGSGAGDGAGASASASASAAARAPLSAKEKAALKASLSRYRKVWATRKGLCIDFVQQMAEAGGLKVAKVFADIGLETDEEAGVNIKDFPL
jgi:26S proteasome regulatory subunit (ATPase 3-interacting protein)